MRKLIEALWIDPLSTTRPSKWCTFPHSKAFPCTSAVSHSVRSNVGKRFGLVDIGRMGSGKKYAVVGRKAVNDRGFVVHRVAHG